MADQQIITTPYGEASIELFTDRPDSVALLRDEVNPHAALYAAKDRGVCRIIELIAAQPVDRFLEAGDLLLPDDLVDLSQGRRSTYFVNRGYGFLSQRPVFCPEVREALLEGARAAGGRVFARGTLAVVEAWEQRQQAAGWGAQAMAASGAPAAYLAKELELCYAPLGMIAAACPPEIVERVVAAALQRLDSAPACGCRTTMQPTRQRGLIGEDWKSWL